MESIGESELNVVYNELTCNTKALSLSAFLDACLSYKPKVLNYYKEHDELVKGIDAAWANLCENAQSHDHLESSGEGAAITTTSTDQSDAANYTLSLKQFKRQWQDSPFLNGLVMSVLVAKKIIEEPAEEEDDEFGAGNPME